MIAACGDANDPTAAAMPPKTPGGRLATIGVENSGLGKILVDSRGRTVYLFLQDSGAGSTCFGECASAWRPVRAKVGTTARPDGKPQVTYNGHPLYLFAGDQNAGDTNGQGLSAFGAKGYVLSPAVNKITQQPSSSGGNGGY
jgi:predicted lipoprotein with Yx(FWY)xxD motif